MRRLLVDCNQLAVDIDAEIAVIHNWVKVHYRPKFPELESLVHHPIDYARVVQAISNEVRIGTVEHEPFLRGCCFSSLCDMLYSMLSTQARVSPAECLDISCT